MRFKFLFPVLQTIAMLLIVWAPRAASKSPGTKSPVPEPRAVDWATGINLPASAVVTPLEFAVRKAEAPPNDTVRFYGVWLVGLLCWYMVGRFVDDLFQWRRNRKLPRKHAGDLTFALIAVPSAALLAITFNDAGRHLPILAAWGVVWVVITCAALLFRVAQAIQQRRKRPVS
jgi:hypothetical protein